MKEKEEKEFNYLVGNYDKENLLCVGCFKKNAYVEITHSIFPLQGTFCKKCSKELIRYNKKNNNGELYIRLLETDLIVAI